MMKNRLTYWFGSILLVTAALATPQDPFESEGATDWEAHALREKPYQLEIAYGDWEPAAPIEGVESMSQVEPDFMELATQLVIASSGNEAGAFQETGRHKVRYRISEKEDGSFDLQIHIQIVGEGPGTTAINSATTLNSSKWIVVGAISRETADGVQKMFTAAVRIVARGPAG